MKRITPFLIALFLCIANMWAVNPKRGYIVTIDGQTVSGTIDFRTDNENAVSCHFMADGQSAYTTYTAAEIKGYGISDPKVKYIAKDIATEGRIGDYFLECLIEGSYNLYALQLGQQCYFLEKNGECNQYYVAQKTPQGVVEKNVIQLINDEGGSYEVFAQKIRKRPTMHFRIMAGAALPATLHFNEIRGALSIVQPSFAISAVQCPDIAVGVDLMLLRINEGLAVQVQAGMLPVDMTGRATIITGAVRDFYYKAFQADVQAGLAYSFKSRCNFIPTIRAGVGVSNGFNPECDYYNYCSTTGTILQTSVYALYAGVGAEYPIAKGAITLNADYVLRQYNINGISFTNLALRLGYRF